MTKIIYGCYCYNREGDLERNYDFETLEEAKKKFEEIKKEGVYSYFYGDVDFVDLVKVKEHNDENWDIIKKIDSCYR